MEIERKFLLEQPPQVAGCASKLIEQAYLCTCLLYTSRCV